VKVSGLDDAMAKYEGKSDTEPKVKVQMELSDSGLVSIKDAFAYFEVKVTEEAKEKAQEELENQLKTDIEQTQNQSTEYVLVPDFATITYGELQDKAEGDSVVLSLSGSVKAYSFIKKDLFNFIGLNSISGATATDTFDLDASKLLFSIAEDAITVSGLTDVTWTTDAEKLKTAFVNKKRSESAALLGSYRSFENANADLSPFWKTRFPSDPANIDVIIQQ
jgi:hypothetical protein